MTTTLKLTNSATSNGDVQVRAHLADKSHMTLKPNQSTELMLTEASQVSIFETWPSDAPGTKEMCAGQKADDLIAAEVAGQDRMWGVANERADSSRGQLLDAGLAQAQALHRRRNGTDSHFSTPACFPAGWDGFRDYGSDVANLVVAAAYIRQEIKRLVAAGEDTTRTQRTKPYEHAQPAAAFSA